MRRHLRASDYKVMPWKNGSGVTTELASCETDQGLMWRISIADMSDDGIFSVFPNIDRVLTVIEGGGLLLKGEALPSMLDCKLLQPMSFAGDMELYGSLKADAVKNFNVMVSRGLATASVEVLSLEKVQRLQVSGDTVFLYLLQAEDACELQHDNQVMSLQVGDSYLLHGKGDMAVSVSEGTAVLLLVTISLS